MSQPTNSHPVVTLSRNALERRSATFFERRSALPALLVDTAVSFQNRTCRQHFLLPSDATCELKISDVNKTKFLSNTKTTVTEPRPRPK